MPQFGFLTYLAIIGAILAHYTYGKRLGVTGTVARCVCGLCLSGLIAATLAHFLPILIRPTLVGLTVVGGVLSIQDVVCTQRDWRKTFQWLFPIVVAGLFLWLSNNPSKTFLDNQETEPVLIYNYHDSYKAGQSIEMLSAGYTGRLRLATLYPYEWARYHFFNGGLHSAALCLIPRPGLLEFYVVQTVLMVLIFLSFLEAVIDRYGVRAQTLILFSIWAISGGSLCWYLFNWHFTSSATISFFAFIHFILALSWANYGLAVFYALLVAVSAIRVLPFGLVAAFLVAVLFFRKTGTIRDRLRLLHPTQLVWLVLFLTYNALTLFCGIQQESPFSKENFFSDNFHPRLLSYRIFGFFLHHPFEKYTHTERFSNFNWYGFFDSMPKGSVKSVLFMVFVIGIMIWAFIILIRRKKGLLKSFGGVVVWCVVSAIISKELFFLNLIVLPYLLLTAALVLETGLPHSRKIVSVLLGLQITTVLVQYSPITFELKAPLMYLSFDLLAWGVIFILLFSDKVGAASKVKFAAILAGLSLFLPPKLSEMVKIPKTPVYENPRLGLLYLKEAHSSRDAFVTREGMLDETRLDYGEWVRNERLVCKSFLAKEVVASVLGAHLPYKPDEPCKIHSPNYRFLVVR